MKEEDLFFDLIVIGGGPAGLFAALQASGSGLKVCLLEKNARAGMKLLLSGSGQCNLTHSGDIRDFPGRFGKGKRFVQPAFLNFTNRQLMSFFEERGVPLEDRGDGKIFPVSRKSRDILDALLAGCNRNDVILRYKEPLLSVEKKKHFILKTAAARYEAAYLLIATGGLSYPTTGSTGDGYGFAHKLGHHPLKSYPVLTPLNIESYPFRSCAGISFFCRAELFRQGRKTGQYEGDLLLTHQGFSGPLILNNSRDMEKGDLLKICFTGRQERQLFQKDLLEVTASAGKRTLRRYLTERDIPDRFVRTLFQICGIPEDRILSQLGKKERGLLLDSLFKFSAVIESKAGFNKAMATGGGISRDEVQAKTMESRVQEGLYFAGEILDVDGDTGGFNLQFAFSSAKLAADHMIRRSSESSLS